MTTLLDLMANEDWEDLRAADRANWDERVAIHLGCRFYDVEGWLRDKPGPDQREIEALGDVTGLRLLRRSVPLSLPADVFTFMTGPSRLGTGR